MVARSPWNESGPFERFGAPARGSFGEDVSERRFAELLTDLEDLLRDFIDRPDQIAHYLRALGDRGELREEDENRLLTRIEDEGAAFVRAMHATPDPSSEQSELLRSIQADAIRDVPPDHPQACSTGP